MNFICDPKNALKKRKLAQTFALDTPGNSQVSTENLSNKMIKKQQDIADWVCLNLLIFLSVLINFCYTTFL